MKDIDWSAWFCTILLIVVFREGAVLITKVFHHPELGNLVGLIALLTTLLIWRRFKKISNRLIDTNKKTHLRFCRFVQARLSCWFIWARKFLCFCLCSP